MTWLDQSSGFSGAGATGFSSRTSLLPALLEVVEGQGDGQGQEQGDDDHVYIDAMLI